MEKGKIIAVWGSPNSGKTTFATKLATAIYDNYQATVIVLYTDLETPVLPVIFPNENPEDVGTIGIPLSKAELDKEEIIKNIMTIKSRQNFGFLGYHAGDNKFSYPKFGRAKAEAFYEKLCDLADYVIVDCTSNLENNVLSAVGIEVAEQVIRLASPDLKSISFYLSQLPVYIDAKYRIEEHIQGINTPNADVFMPIEETKQHLKDVNFSVPYCEEVKVQMQSGMLYETTSDKRFELRLKEIAGKVVMYGQD
jgi:MinD-like ATPase involved in chromosome partitioning or flagellar assembly